MGLERGAADQPAIDVGHGEYVPRISRLDTAAIQDAQTCRDFSILRRDTLAYEGMHFLRLLRRRRAAGANGPDRLIGDDRTAQGLDATELRDRFQLRTDDPFGTSGLALGE